MEEGSQKAANEIAALDVTEQEIAGEGITMFGADDGYDLCMFEESVGRYMDKEQSRMMKSDQFDWGEESEAGGSASDTSSEREFKAPRRTAKPAKIQDDRNATTTGNRYGGLELSPVTETGHMSGKGMRLPEKATPEAPKFKLSPDSGISDGSQTSGESVAEEVQRKNKEYRERMEELMREARVPAVPSSFGGETPRAQLRKKSPIRTRPQKLECQVMYDQSQKSRDGEQSAARR